MPKFFNFIFQEEDGSEKEYRVEKQIVSGAELMDLLKVPLEVGLVWLKEDETQQVISADDKFTFEGPGRRLKKAPTFKRG